MRRAAHSSCLAPRFSTRSWPERFVPAILCAGIFATLGAAGLLRNPSSNPSAHSDLNGATFNSQGELEFENGGFADLAFHPHDNELIVYADLRNVQVVNGDPLPHLFAKIDHQGPFRHFKNEESIRQADSEVLAFKNVSPQFTVQFGIAEGPFHSLPKLFGSLRFVERDGLVTPYIPTQPDSNNREFQAIVRTTSGKILCSQSKTQSDPQAIQFAPIKVDPRTIVQSNFEFRPVTWSSQELTRSQIEDTHLGN